MLTLPSRAAAACGLQPQEQKSHEPLKLDAVLQLSLDFIRRELASAATFKGEKFSVFTLLPSLRTGHYSARTRGPYEVPIWIGREHFRVTVRPEATRNPMGVLDLRLLSVLVSIIATQVKVGLPVANPFVVEVATLLEAMGLPKDGGNKRYILEVMERLEATGFTIDGMSAELAERYRGLVTAEKRFRLVTGYTVVSWRGRGGKTPEFIRITLDEDLFRRVVASPEDGLLLSLHPSAMRERAPLALKVYYWARRAVQHSHEPTSWTWAHLHREIEPLANTTLFRRDVRKSILQGRYDPQKGAAVLHGYLLKEDAARKLVYMWADPRDFIVGRDAYYDLVRRVVGEEGGRAESRKPRRLRSPG
jgi:hypothetical protein